MNDTPYIFFYFYGFIGCLCVRIGLVVESLGV